MKPVAALLIALAGAVAMPAYAEDAAAFSDTAVSLVHGVDYLLDPSSQSIVTLEHARSGRWGDLYMFVDSTHYGHDNAHGHRSEWYGEFSPRASLGKISGTSLAFGPVKDVLIAATYERGRDHPLAEAALIGIGSDLAVPGFSFFQANVYRRKEVHNGGWDAWQVTLTGARPFNIGAQHFVIDGFIDYVGGGGPQHPNLHAVPHLRWDVGRALGHRDGAVWLGLRADLWHNKFGIEDNRQMATDQRAVALVLRWHL